MQSPTFCPPRIWNQGKAADTCGLSAAIFCPPRIWNQGKAVSARLTIAGVNFAPPGFGIKAKRLRRLEPWRILPPGFGIKAKPAHRWPRSGFCPPGFGIKAKRRASSDFAPRIWNQGKAGRSYDSRLHFAPPGFGIKAKRCIASQYVCDDFAPPGFGIKAKRGDDPGALDGILPPPDLESRQSRRIGYRSGQ